jgi:hypothetical protein
MPPARSTAGRSTPSRPVRGWAVGAPAHRTVRGRAVGALAVALALSVGGVSTSGAAAQASPRPVTVDRAPAGPEAACVREGLASIPVSLRASAEEREGTGRPWFEVQWSGKPLPPGCDVRRSVAVYFVLWFPHLRFFFTEGFPIHWLQFWNGRRAVRGERERYVSGASYGGLECIRRARAKLRYKVTAPDGKVLARRIVAAPVKLPPCSQ